jgi:hypothetical protein
MTGTWNVQLEDGQHSIRADLNPWINRIKVYFDNNLINSSFALLMLGEVYAFERNGHHFIVSIKGISYLGGHFTLSIDGLEAPQGGLMAPPPPPSQAWPQRQTMPPPAQFIQEVNVVETSEVYRSEEYPFDNRYSDSDFSTEREISEESTNEFLTEDSNQVNGKIGLDIIPMLKAEVAAQVSKKVGHKIGENITESQTLHLKVGPKSSVVYHITWKRKIRSGEYLYLVNGNTVSIPYRMKYGLSVEVRTSKLNKEE